MATTTPVSSLGTTSGKTAPVVLNGLTYYPTTAGWFQSTSSTSPNYKGPAVLQTAFVASALGSAKTKTAPATLNGITYYPTGSGDWYQSSKPAAPNYMASGPLQLAFQTQVTQATAAADAAKAQAAAVKASGAPTTAPAPVSTAPVSAPAAAPAATTVESAQQAVATAQATINQIKTFMASVGAPTTLAKQSQLASLKTELTTAQSNLTKSQNTLTTVTDAANKASQALGYTDYAAQKAADAAAKTAGYADDRALQSANKAAQALGYSTAAAQKTADAAAVKAGYASDQALQQANKAAVSAGYANDQALQTANRAAVAAGYTDAAAQRTAEQKAQQDAAAAAQLRAQQDAAAAQQAAAQQATADKAAQAAGYVNAADQTAKLAAQKEAEQQAATQAALAQQLAERDAAALKAQQEQQAAQAAQLRTQQDQQAAAAQAARNAEFDAVQAQANALGITLDRESTISAADQLANAQRARAEQQAVLDREAAARAADQQRIATEQAAAQQARQQADAAAQAAGYKNAADQKNFDDVARNLGFENDKAYQAANQTAQAAGYKDVADQQKQQAEAASAAQTLQAKIASDQAASLARATQLEQTQALLTQLGPNNPQSTQYPKQLNGITYQSIVADPITGTPGQWYSSTDGKTWTAVGQENAKPISITQLDQLRKTTSSNANAATQEQKNAAYAAETQAAQARDQQLAQQAAQARAEATYVDAKQFAPEVLAKYGITPVTLPDGRQVIQSGDRGSPGYYATQASLQDLTNETVSFKDMQTRQANFTLPDATKINQYTPEIASPDGKTVYRAIQADPVSGTPAQWFASSDGRSSWSAVNKPGEAPIGPAIPADVFAKYGSAINSRVSQYNRLQDELAYNQRIAAYNASLPDNRDITEKAAEAITKFADKIIPGGVKTLMTLYSIYNLPWDAIGDTVSGWVDGLSQSDIAQNLQDMYGIDPNTAYDITYDAGDLVSQGGATLDDLASVGYDPTTIADAANYDQYGMRILSDAETAEIMSGVDPAYYNSFQPVPPGSEYGLGGPRYVENVDLTAPSLPEITVTAPSGFDLSPLEIGGLIGGGLLLSGALGGGGAGAGGAAAAPPAPTQPVQPTTTQPTPEPVQPTQPATTQPVQPSQPIETAPLQPAPVEPVGPPAPVEPVGPPSPFEPTSPEFVGPPAPVEPVAPPAPPAPAPVEPVGPPSPFEPTSPEFVGPPAPPEVPVVPPEGPMGPPSPFEPTSPEFVGPPAPVEPVPTPPSQYPPGSEYGPGGPRYVEPVDITAPVTPEGPMGPPSPFEPTSPEFMGPPAPVEPVGPPSPFEPTSPEFVGPPAPVEPVAPPVPEGPMGPPSPFEPTSPEFMGPPAPEGPVGPPSPFEPTSPEFNGPPAPTDTGPPVVDRTPDWVNPNPTPDPTFGQAVTNLTGLTPEQIALGWVLINGVATPPAPPKWGGYGPLDYTYTPGKFGALADPGLNPGFIGPVKPFYKTTSPVQSQFYWGQHPYMATAADLANYNNIPGAPAVPWGAQQGYQPLDIQDFINRNVNEYTQAASQGRAPVGPVAPT